MTGQHIAGFAVEELLGVALLSAVPMLAFAAGDRDRLKCSCTRSAASAGAARCDQTRPTSRTADALAFVAHQLAAGGKGPRGGDLVRFKHPKQAVVHLGFPGRVNRARAWVRRTDGPPTRVRTIGRIRRALFATT
jgi:hypothetical protein